MQEDATAPNSDLELLYREQISIKDDQLRVKDEQIAAMTDHNKRIAGWRASRFNSIRASVEHVFGHQKNRYGLFIRTIGLARAEAKMILANLAYNFDRLIFHERRRALA